MAFIAVSAGIAAVATITVGAIKNDTQKKMNAGIISNMKQESRLKLLNNSQRLALDTKIASAKTDTERIAIYSQAISQLGSTTIESTASIYAAGAKIKAQENYLTKSIVMASGFVLIGGAIYVLRKK